VDADIVAHPSPLLDEHFDARSFDGEDAKHEATVIEQHVVPHAHVVGQPFALDGDDPLVVRVIPSTRYASTPLGSTYCAGIVPVRIFGPHRS